MMIWTLQTFQMKFLLERINMGNLDPNSMMFRADRGSINRAVRTINGNAVKLVAIQKSRRRRRKGRTKYIWHIQNTNIVVFNKSKNGIYFMRMAIRIQNIKRYHDVFVVEPLTDKEREWLERYDYVLVH